MSLYTEPVLLQGLFVPLTCPFYRDGGSYLRKLEHNVARYSLGPAAGLLALPPGGEAAGLTDEEAASSLHAVAQFAGKAKVLLAGVEKNSLAAALERVRQAEEAGFDAAVVAPPPEWPRLVRGDDVRALLTFYRTLADQALLPVVFWSDRRAPSLQLPVDLIAEMAGHPRVLGLMDADLTPERFAALKQATVNVQREVTVTPIFEAVTRRMRMPEPVTTSAPALVSVESLTSGAATSSAVAPAIAVPLKTRQRAVGFQILAAVAASEMLPLLHSGVSGVVPPLAACAPQGCFEAYAAWKDGDMALAEERAGRFHSADALIAELGPAAAKYGCDLNGYFGGQPRLPRLPLTGEERLLMERALAVLRN